MEERFIGRERELRLLREAWAGEASAFIPVYGRRRVGKSELILRFMTGRPGLYYLGKKAPPALQLREFLREASAALDEPILADLPTADWRAALSAVTDRMQARGKHVLAFDEFQWTAEASPELPSLLQEFWDRRWRVSGRMLLILCGSYVGFMERDVLGRQSPLFGRRTAQILLRPFGYREAAEFHPGYSLPERAKAYFVCGGVPLYLRYFTGSRFVETNIAANLFSEFGPLFREPDFLLREELREVENYYAVLLALASGFSTHAEIAARSEVAPRNLHYYLQQLVELGYVARRYPLTGRRPVPRHVRFGLEDPLLRFWFRFVYPNQSFLAQMGPERALQERVRPHLDAYWGIGFERLCREALPSLYEREGVASAFEVGEYWDRTLQIDVVGLGDDGWTDLGECKWGPVRSERELRADLEAKIGRYPNPRQAAVGRRLFTRTRLRACREPDSSLRCHCLEDLYGP